MSPTFNPIGDQSNRNDWVLLSKFNSAFNPGDVVFFKNPHNHRQTLVKRIVAIQGDLVRRKPPGIADLLFIPDILYNFSKGIMHQNFEGDTWIVVPEGHVWVESDSADDRVVDSRHYGPVPIGLIVGRVEMILFPMDRFGKSLQASKSRIVDEGRLITRQI